jgi:hypothetical protein
MQLKNTLKLYYFVLQRVAGTYPRLFLALYKLFGRSKHLLLTEDCDIVIEGFPRSCNTFAVVAFEFPQQKPPKVGHHLHVPAQMINAARFNLPAILLIRDPEEAIVSLLIREPYISMKEALKEYIRFYSPLKPYGDSFVVAEFSEVTSDFGGIMERVNAKFGTSFMIFDHTKENVDSVFELVQYYGMKESADGKLDETKVARPSGDRSAAAEEYIKELSSDKYRQLLDRANLLYISFTQA